MSEIQVSMGACLRRLRFASTSKLAALALCLACSTAWAAADATAADSAGGAAGGAIVDSPDGPSLESPSSSSVNLAQSPTYASATATNTTTGEYRSDNANGRDDDDSYGAVINRLTITGGYDRMSTLVRADTIAFSRRPSRRLMNEVQLERLSVQYGIGSFTVAAGDYYQQLGRGLVLSIRKGDEVGLDLAIRGGQVAYASDWLAATVFAGQLNTANLDLVTQAHVKNVNDRLAGATVDVPVLEIAHVGAFALYFEPQERLLDTRDRSVTGGGYVDAPALFGGLAAMYLEADSQRRVQAGGTVDGAALYGTTDLHLGDTTLLAEGIYLRDFEQKGSRNSATNTRFLYNLPPTLQRLQDEVQDSANVLGARLRAEYFQESIDAVWFANGLWRVDGFGQPGDVRTLHGYGGVELTMQDGTSRLTSSAGYREERQQERRIKSMVHGELEWMQALTEGFSLHLSTTNELRTLEERAYMRGSTYLGVEKHTWGEALVELGRDTQDPTDGIRHWFLAGIVSWHALESVQLRAVVGTQRGGIKCYSGLCRDYPPFAGLRTEVVVRL